MLEVLMLKVRHAGKQRAKALAPHIAQCDVYYPEMFPLVDKDLPLVEQSWEEMLASTKHVSEFYQWFKRGQRSADPQAEAFKEKEAELLYRNKVRLHLLEGFSEDEHERLCAHLKQSQELHVGAAILDLHGHHEDSLQLVYRGILHEGLARRMRDERIGQNLDAAEARIRERYAHLQEKDPVRLGLSIGAMHHPERYATIAMRIVDLDDTPWRVKEEDVERRIVAGATYEEMASDIKDILKLHSAT